MQNVLYKGRSADEAGRLPKELRVYDFLDIEPGAVSVMGLMNDTENRVRLIVDEDVLKAEWFGCHPCVNTTSMRMKVADVFGPYLDAVHHDYTTVHLEGEE